MADSECLLYFVQNPNELPCFSHCYVCFAGCAREDQVIKVAQHQGGAGYHMAELVTSLGGTFLVLHQVWRHYCHGLVSWPSFKRLVNNKGCQLASKEQRKMLAHAGACAIFHLSAGLLTRQCQAVAFALILVSPGLLGSGFCRISQTKLGFGVVSNPTLTKLGVLRSMAVPNQAQI